MLYYDQRARRFVGSRYLVSPEAFFDRVHRLCRSGQNLPDALEKLRDEATWSLADAGVAPLYTTEALIAEAEAILAAQRQRRSTTADGHAPAQVSSTLPVPGAVAGGAAERAAQLR